MEKIFLNSKEISNSNDVEVINKMGLLKARVLRIMTMMVKYFLKVR